ncbi:MAG: outer membrane beta-barrel protein [Acidobacteriaceae bacterium]
MKKYAGLLCSLLFAGLLFAAPKAHAQSPESAIGDWSSLSVGGTFSATRLQYGQHWLEGGGVFVDVNLNWRFGVEGEANWAVLHQMSKTHAETYLVGPRYQMNAIGNYRFRPYAKFLAGDGEFNFPYNYAHGSYFVMAPGGGLDYRLNSRFRIRLIDAEYQYWPGFTYGSQTNLSVSVGVRYRIR